jgi:hypothetical protein
MRDHAQRRPPLPVRLTPAERDFHVELRRLVDAAGLSFRALEESTSAARYYSRGFPVRGCVAAQRDVLAD